MTTQEQVAAILEGHKPIDLGGGIAMRPLTMEDLLDPAMLADVTAIGKQIFGAIEQIAGIQAALDAGAAGEWIDQLLGLLTPVLPAVRRALARCVNKPLAELPLALAPILVRTFISQNFTSLQLLPWADLLQSVKGKTLEEAKRAGKTSATSSSSSSNTDIPAGGTTPASSSSSGSGAAPDVNCAARPTSSTS